MTNIQIVSLATITGLIISLVLAFIYRKIFPKLDIDSLTVVSVSPVTDFYNTYLMCVEDCNGKTESFIGSIIGWHYYKTGNRVQFKLKVRLTVLFIRYPLKT